jgi:DNA-binding CsgD family transcriptional regulator
MRDYIGGEAHLRPAGEPNPEGAFQGRRGFPGRGGGRPPLDRTKKTVPGAKSAAQPPLGGGGQAVAAAFRALAGVRNPSPGQRLWYTLTAREIEIAQLVSTGKRNKEVAKELHLSRYTVETHLKNIYGKLQIQSRTELTNVVRDNTLSQSSAGT